MIWHQCPRYNLRAKFSILISTKYVELLFKTNYETVACSDVDGLMLFVSSTSNPENQTHLIELSNPVKSLLFANNDNFGQPIPHVRVSLCQWIIRDCQSSLKVRKLQNSQWRSCAHSKHLHVPREFSEKMQKTLVFPMRIGLWFESSLLHKK